MDKIKFFAIISGIITSPVILFSALYLSREEEPKREELSYSLQGCNQDEVSYQCYARKGDMSVKSYHQELHNCPEDTTHFLVSWNEDKWVLNCWTKDN